MINQAIKMAPELFTEIGPNPIVDGNWQDRISGRKTAVRSYNYKHPDFPNHFTKTRCVFCTAEHKCRLQIFSEQHTNHPWTYKPTSCWMLPLRTIKDKAVAPPRNEDKDPHDIGQPYPEFIKYVPCGQEQPKGLPWKVVLKKEIARYTSASYLTIIPPATTP